MLAGALATIIALIVGMTAGYMQGIVDEVLSFLINLGLVVPALPLMISIAAYSPVRGVAIIIFVIGLTGWAWGARSGAYRARTTASSASTKPRRRA